MNKMNSAAIEDHVHEDCSCVFMSRSCSC